jgi:hypothetical protein
MVRPAELVYRSFLSAIVGARVEFRGYNRGQNCPLEDPGILTQPKVVFASAEANVYPGIE